MKGEMTNDEPAGRFARDVAGWHDSGTLNRSAELGARRDDRTSPFGLGFKPRQSDFLARLARREMQLGRPYWRMVPPGPSRL